MTVRAADANAVAGIRASACGLALAVAVSGCQAKLQPPTRFVVEQHHVAVEVGQQQVLEHGSITLLEQHQTDLDGDGDLEQIGVLLMQSGGSGSFYYVAAADWRDDQWRSLGSVFVGDRIVLDGVKLFPAGHVDSGSFYLSYYVHDQQQALAEPPRFYLSKQFALVGGELTHISAY